MKIAEPPYKEDTHRVVESIPKSRGLLLLGWVLFWMSISYFIVS